MIENSDNKMKTIQDIAKLLDSKKKRAEDIHQINVDGTIISDSQIIANSFNKYFLSIIGNHISVAIGKKPIDYLHQVFKETFPTIKYQNTTTAEIEKKSLNH
jgi:ribosomal silencing factor RsfS